MSEPSYVSWYGRGRQQNWMTPRSLFDPLNEDYRFTLDGASEPGNGLLPNSSTAENPLSWEGERVFCNPPWSNIASFVEQAVDAELAVLLVPARTNARWFHRALDLGAKVRFFVGRPSFDGGPNGQKGHNSPVDCVLLVFGESCRYCGQEDGHMEDCESGGRTRGSLARLDGLAAGKDAI